MSTNLQKGDLAIIAGELNFFSNRLIVRPEIKKPADLRGKAVAIGGFGAANHTALLVALDKLAVNAKEVNIIQVAGAAAQLTALIKGAIQGVIFNEPQATIAIKKFGMQSLIDLSDSKIPFPQNSFIVKRSYLDANRDKVTNFMKAVIESIYLLKRDRALAIRIIKKYLRVNRNEKVRLHLAAARRSFADHAIRRLQSLTRSECCHTKETGGNDMKLFSYGP